MLGKSLAMTIMALGLTSLAIPAEAQKGGIIANANQKPKATEMMKEARASAVPQDPYLQSLRRNFLGLAEFEYSRMEDYFSATFYAERTLEASAGGDVLPQSIEDRDIAPEFHGELQANRERLMTALDDGGRDALPDAAGHATALYDCWLEQQEEGHQVDDINGCKNNFYREIENLERALAARKVIADTTEIFSLDADVLFDFDQDTIRPDAAEALIGAADAINKSGASQIVLVGHTDSTGDSLYNMDLSQRRADSVHDFLVENGIADDLMISVAMGETQPVDTNSTAEGRAANRRVVVRASN
jgi:OOP family OmpA-OmpF porin